MLLRKIFCGLACCLPLLALADPIPAGKLAYVGEWNGRGLNLVVERDGGIRYSRISNGKVVSFVGDFVGFRGNSLEVRVGEKRVTIAIEGTPGSNDGVWGAVVEGIKVHRIRDL